MDRPLIGVPLKGGMVIGKIEFQPNPSLRFGAQTAIDHAKAMLEVAKARREYRTRVDPPVPDPALWETA